MFMLPQEVEVWYIIPAVRKEYAKRLTKHHNLSYEKVGRILGTTKAAVSQYLSNKRANKVVLSREVKEMIRESSKRVARNPKIWLTEVENVLKFMRKTKCSCNVCKRYNKEILEYCNCEPKY
ncbi:hypothetical protein D6829_02570 [Candidatus Pacearchaeota archaeon]|nr:MAG: hypothetical protein D6829_02570 [Candidatus Pacearchaeota archaeon]